ncbi:hypothetical protein [Roseateles sp.]|uniref:hypothetical protein n=1 Tax=Roseateles sp. TaxID=1971397 RepID=UPI003D0EB9AE
MSRENLPCMNGSRVTLLAALLLSPVVALAAEPAPTVAASAKDIAALKARVFDIKKAYFRADEVVPADKSSLRQEMQRLFKSFECPLPQRVLDKIKNTNPDGFIPPDLDAKLFPDPAILPKYTAVKGQAAAAALASIQFPKTDGGSIVSARLKSASQYATLNPLALVDKSSDAVVYTMDCSGYLTSTFNLEVSLGAADLKSFAKGLVNGSRSVSVAQATVTSPVIAALYPLTVPTKIRPSAREKLELLHAAIAEIDLVRPSAPDAMQIDVLRELRLLWASNKGKSSAQGEARVESGGGGGIGVASVKATADAGGTISREMAFESFETYLIEDAALQPQTSTTYAVLRAEVVRTVADSATSAPDSLNAGWVKDHFEASFRDLTDTVCGLAWKPETTTNGGVSTRWDKDANICVFSFKPSGTWTSAGSVTLKANGLQPRLPGLPLAIEMPLTGKP